MNRLLGIPLAWIYSGLVALRSYGFSFGILKVHRLPGKVISIGNLAVGGTGKSPVVISLADFLRLQGNRPAILTRGYGAGLRRHESLLILNRNIINIQDPARKWTRPWPDEAMMQSQMLLNVPVIVGANRWQAAQRYLKYCDPRDIPTHWILDDGFQHRQIYRDIDIVLIDGKRLLERKRLLPWGRLRENPLALKRASVIFLTRSNNPDSGREALSEYLAHPKVPVLSVPIEAMPLGESVNQLTCMFDPIRHLPTLLVCGVAFPERVREHFLAMYNKQESKDNCRFLYFKDHEYLPKERIVNRLLEVNSVFTTAKDFARNPQVFMDLPKPVFIQSLDVGISLDTWNKVLGLRLND